jgi:hypothetical protein
VAKAKRRRRKRKLTIKRLIKSIREHPVLSLGLALSVGGLVAQSYWLHIGIRYGWITSTAIFAIVCLVWLLLGLGWGAVYVVVGYHPVTGIPCCSYVGKTTQRTWSDEDGCMRYPRIEQHLLGSTYYGTSAKPWADLVIGWNFVHESGWFTAAILGWFEWANIRWRRPVHNYMMNLKNPDRIPIPVQHKQRAQRDHGTFTVTRHREVLSRSATFVQAIKLADGRSGFQIAPNATDRNGVVTHGK